MAVEMWVLVKGDADGRRHPVGVFTSADLAKEAADMQTRAYGNPPLHWQKFRGRWLAEEAAFGLYDYSVKPFTVDVLQDPDD